jgi:hypothetical protein
VTPLVVEDAFWSALDAAQYLQDGKDDGGGGGDGDGDGSENRMQTLKRNSETFGFRVCYYTLLCAGAKMQGRPILARRYYELARTYLGPCLEYPSQHLVSALLLITMITRSISCDPAQAALHASLALRMCDIVAVSGACTGKRRSHASPRTATCLHPTLLLSLGVAAGGPRDTGHGHHLRPQPQRQGRQPVARPDGWLLPPHPLRRDSGFRHQPGASAGPRYLSRRPVRTTPPPSLPAPGGR